MNSAIQFQGPSHFQNKKEDILKGEIPFLDVFPDSSVAQVFTELGIEYRERVFSPLLTLWLFVGQILSSDRSCRAVVSRLSAFNKGLRSLSTTGYCLARKRLRLDLIQNLNDILAFKLQEAQPVHWLWKQRQVKLVDGTTFSMPDTPANQQAFPQSSSQKPGLGFPIARALIISCASCGCILKVALGPYQGKGSGEASLFKKLIGCFHLGDIALCDRYFASYPVFASLVARQADVICRQHHLRKTDFRKGKRLGENDHIVTLTRPSSKSDSLSEAEFKNLPSHLEVREIRSTIKRKGFRDRKLTVITTLLNAEKYPADEVIDLYQQRWLVELDIRSIKSDLGLSILSCKSPDMIQKEVSCGILAYNFIRLLMAQSAVKAHCRPRQISFKATVQVYTCFADRLSECRGDQWTQEYVRMLKLIATQEVGKRPNRFEPRAIKRRSLGTQDLLTKPRTQARADLSRKRVS